MAAETTPRTPGLEERDLRDFAWREGATPAGQMLVRAADEIARLTATQDRLSAENQGLHGALWVACDQRDAARAERDALRKALEQIVALTFASPMSGPLPPDAPYRDKERNDLYNRVVRVNAVARSALKGGDR